MRVVHINAVYGAGSTGRAVMELNDELKKRENESYVFCSNVSDEKHGIFCMGTPFTRAIHAFLSRLTGLQGYFSYGATKKLIRQLDIIKPNIVHLGNLHGNYIHVNMLLDYLAENDIPTVITLHDCWLFTGHCCHYLEDNCYKWQESCGHCPARHKWNTSWLFDRSKKVLKDRKERYNKIRSLLIVGVSDWVTNEAKKSILRGNAKFERIYNWINLDIFSPHNDLPIKKEKSVLAVSAGWSKRKGLNDIINIAKSYPNYQFVMVGKMPDNIRLPLNVQAVGTIKDIDKLADEYRRADVLLHLSYEETFGKVIAEALACGTPAVVYDVTAMPELIGPGCGQVVQLGDWKSAGEAVNKILNASDEENGEINKINDIAERYSKCEVVKENHSTYSKINQSKCCRNYAISHFDRQLVIKEWMTAYYQLLQDHQSTG